MKQITANDLKKDDYLLYIHTPFCGTCHYARAMLTQIEDIHQQAIFYEMNASYFSEFMQEHEVESVPCLLIKQNGIIKEKIYTFHSVPNMSRYILQYKPELFEKREK